MKPLVVLLVSMTAHAAALTSGWVAVGAIDRTVDFQISASGPGTSIEAHFWNFNPVLICGTEETCVFTIPQLTLHPPLFQDYGAVTVDGQRNVITSLTIGFLSTPMSAEREPYWQSGWQYHTSTDSIAVSIIAYTAGGTFVLTGSGSAILSATSGVGPLSSWSVRMSMDSPEPSTWALVLAGGLMAIRRIRKA